MAPAQMMFLDHVPIGQFAVQGLEGGSLQRGNTALAGNAGFLGQ